MIVELSRYAFIILIAMYTFLSFSVLRKKNQEEINHGWKVQNLITFLIHLLAFGVIFIQTWQIRILIFYLLQFFLLQAVLVFTRLIYPQINRLVLNNMCFLLMIGFVILTRLSFDRAVPAVSDCGRSPACFSDRAGADPQMRVSAADSLGVWDRGTASASRGGPCGKKRIPEQICLWFWEISAFSPWRR